MARETTPMMGSPLTSRGVSWHTSSYTRSSGNNNRTNDNDFSGLRGIRETGVLDGEGNGEGAFEAGKVHKELGIAQRRRSAALAIPGVGPAAFLVRDAFLGMSENPSDGAYNPYIHPDSTFVNDVSIWCHRITNQIFVRRILRWCLFVLVMVTFFEPPNWCLSKDSGSCKEKLSMTGPSLSNPNVTVEYYPNTGTTFLTEFQSVAVELGCVSILWIYLALCIGRDGCSLVTYFRPGPAQRVRILETSSLTMLTIGIIGDMASNYTLPRFMAPFWRLVILVSFSRESQREIETMFRLVSPHGHGCLSVRAREREREKGICVVCLRTRFQRAIGWTILLILLEPPSVSYFSHSIVSFDPSLSHSLSLSRSLSLYCPDWCVCVYHYRHRPYTAECPSRERFNPAVHLHHFLCVDWCGALLWNG